MLNGHTVSVRNYWDFALCFMLWVKAAQGGLRAVTRYVGLTSCFALLKNKPSPIVKGLEVQAFGMWFPGLGPS